jgi:aminopeptidase N
MNYFSWNVERIKKSIYTGSFLLTFFYFEANSQIPSNFCKTFPSNVIYADNSRSDTIDILNYAIHLDITDISGKTITGNCKITFSPKLNNVSEINLDLLELNIDSISLNNSLLNYNYNDTLLKIQLPSVFNYGDTEIVNIYYNGSPQKDASGWGGFYFQSGYAFNLGVGFDANPHNYGRVWFPCFDNFIERSTYTFTIITDSLNKAFCNGELLGQTNNGNATTTWSWQMNKEIPSYLASVAVAKYETIQQTYYGIQDTIPIQIGAAASDTTKVKTSFSNLNAALNTFETHYGPYAWNRVGYVIVPFNSGAMEHATNIAYPQYAASGSLTYETLYAHELSHHWWGDLVTCKTAEDMWLNEGMAVFSEFLFTETVYGKDEYLKAVNDNHEYVIHFLHHTEDGYKAISGVSHEYTYSGHVYNKGADVAHTLRGYLGDSLFFNGLTAFLNTYKYSDVTSHTLRDFLSSYTGIDLTSFFNDWVFSPGFAHFSIDSFSVITNGNKFTATVYIKQKSGGTPDYYTNVPLELTFMDQSFQKYTETIIMSGSNVSFSTETPFLPEYVGIDLDDKISDAITAHEETIDSSGEFDFGIAHIDITVNSISDSAFVRVEHNWAAPDSFKNTSSNIAKLSPNRYWKIDGIFPSILQASAKIYYNGKSNSSGYLDNDLINTTEDSLILVYRINAAGDWKEFPYYTINYSGPLTDKYGYIIIDSLMKGEYSLALGKSTTKIREELSSMQTIKIYPNPAKNKFTINLTEINFDENLILEIRNESGSLVWKEKIKNNIHDVNVGNLSNGNYFIEIKSGKFLMSSEKILVTK